MKRLRLITLLCAAIIVAGWGLSGTAFADSPPIVVPIENNGNNNNNNNNKPISKRCDYTYTLETKSDFWDSYYIPPGGGKHKPFSVTKVEAIFTNLNATKTTTVVLTKNNPSVTQHCAAIGNIAKVTLHVYHTGGKNHYDFEYKPSNYSKVVLSGNIPVHAPPEIHAGRSTGKLTVNIKPQYFGDYYHHQGPGHKDNIYRIAALKVILEEKGGGQLETVLSRKNPFYQYPGAKEIAKATFIIGQSDGETVKKEFKNPPTATFFKFIISEDIKVYEYMHLHIKQ